MDKKMTFMLPDFTNNQIQFAKLGLGALALILIYKTKGSDS